MREPAFIREPQEFEREEDDGLDLRAYWRVLWGRKWVILGLAFMITLLAALWSAQLTHVYRGTATILIQDRQANLVSIEQVYAGEVDPRGFIPTQVGILESREMARKLVGRMGLVEHPAFHHVTRPEATFRLRDYVPTWLGGQLGAPAEPLSPAQLFDRVLDEVQKNLHVEPVRLSQLVDISFESRDRELAAEVPNVLTDVYIESDLEAKLAMTQKAASWLSERLDSLRGNLEASERALQTYREQAGIVVTGSGDSTATRFDQLSSRLLEARQARVEAETIHRQAGDLGTGNLQRLESVPAVQRHPMVQSSYQAQVQADLKVTELSQRYGPRHPRLIAAVSQRDAARAETRAQIRKVIEGVEREYQMALRNEQALEREVAQARSQVQDIDRKEYRLRVLERDVESNRELYDMFLARSKETGVAADVQSAIARIVDPAVVPKLPHKPHKSRIVLVALVLGLILGGLLAWLLESLDNTFKSTEDLERRLGLAVLGMLPLLKKNGKATVKPEKVFENDPKGAFAEAVRTIRTGVMLSGLDSPQKILVVTSSVPGEGKSTLAINLAIALSHMERVLLVDADMRRPTLARHMNLPKGVPGLSALVAGSAKSSECFHKTGYANLHLLPCGVVPPNPLELLSSKRFVDALNKLSGLYDRIVIDSAPTAAVSDSLVLSRLASAVIYVVKSDATPHHVAQQGIKRLREIDAPLLGVVLNQLDTSKAARYYGKYGYYHGYGYTNPAS